jgi:hypothetical protein
LLSRRYSKLPSDFLKLDITDYQFNMLVAIVGLDAEKKAQEKSRSKGRR